MNDKQTRTPAPAPLTRKYFTQKMGEYDAKLDDSIAKTETKLEGLRKEIGAVKYYAEELEKDKRGVEKFHARATKLEAEVKRITERFDAIKGDVSSNDLDPVQVTAYKAEFERLNGRLEDLFGRASSELSELRERFDSLETDHEALTGVVNDNAGVLSKLGSSHNRLTGRVNDVEVTLKSLVQKFPIGRVVVAVVIGVIAGVLWSNHTFTSTIPLPGGPLEYEDWRNEPYVAWIFGSFPAALFLAVSLLISKKPSSPDRASQKSGPADEFIAQQHTIPQNPNPVTTPYSGEAAPTQQLAAQGAASGTR